MATTNTELLSALIVDDHTLVSSLLASELNRQGISAITAETIEQAFSKIRSSKPDVVLLDVELDEPLSITQVRDLVRRSAPGKIALFTSKASETFVRNCLDVGVCGLIPKSFSISSLSSALNLISTGQIFVPISKQSVTTISELDEKYSLSINDRQVLEKLTEGMSNKDIHISLNIPETTVKMRVRTLCQKLGAENRTQVVIIAQRLGLV